MEYHLEEAIRDLSKGTWLYKLRNSKTFYRRRFHLFMKGKYITYDGSKKISCAQRTFRVDFHEIEDVRRGWKTDMFNIIEGNAREASKRKYSFNKVPKVQENLCFSIILNDYSTVDLIAECETVLDHWLQVLSFIVASNKNAEKEREKDQWLKDKFRKADLNKDGSLDFQECLKLLKQLNISMTRRQAKFLFDEANNISDETDSGDCVLQIDEFLYFYHRLVERKDLDVLFKKYSGTTMNVMGPEDLRRFLQEEQGMVLTLEECKAKIEAYQPDLESLHGYLSITGFHDYIMSPEFDIFNKDHHEVYQDMTQPLTHYFIASSHNTYLISDQLIGASSVEGYVKALLKGCRCVELDCWDGSDGEPVIYHGHTLTSKILFRDVLDAINLFAFKASKYPLILSIENHCSLEYQRTMAGHLIRVFGDNLYMTPVPDDIVNLPSPEELCNKIIVKAKKIKIEEEENDSYSLSSESSIDEEELSIMENPKAVEQEPSVNQELSDIINLCQSAKFRSFHHSQHHRKCYHISSFAENKANGLIKKKHEQYILHNQTFFSRIYPSGVRTDSSNYDPIPLWNAGCQIVALNYQTEGKSMRLNDAKFMDNGGCGYILKPKYMREGTLASEGEYIKKQKKVLHIKIISGQHIPKPDQAVEGEIVDPYVKIVIRGKHMDDKEECKTRYIRNNGFNPMWNEKFDLNVDYPETSCIEFIVKDSSTTGTNEFLGGYVMPICCLKEGYRNVWLKDKRGNKLPMASIFVHVKMSNAEDL